MPYIRIELDGKKKWPMVAQGLGVPRGNVAVGLSDLYEMAYTEQSDQVTAIQLECLFGCAGSRAGDVLEAFGFLERLDGVVYRIRGAETYLQVAASKSAGGKARVATAKRDQQGRLLAENSPASIQQESSRPPAETQPLHHTPNTIHHSSSKEEEVFERAKRQPRPPVREMVTRVERPTAPETEWIGQDFGRWFQFKRQAAGFVPEDPIPIHEMEEWFVVAKECVGGDVPRLKAAVINFGQSKHWQRANPPLPIRAFMRVFKNFVPQEKTHARAG